MKGLVVKNTGSWYTVRTDDGQLLDCKVKGNFRLKGIRTTNPVAVGDRVNFELNKEGFAFIDRILERRNYMIRKSINLSKQAHILATNLDLALLIVTASHPLTSTTFIDRFLATAEAYRIPVLLVINKMDLYAGEDLEYVNYLSALYRYIGYPVFQVSVKTGLGLAELKRELTGKTTLLSGNSGVGKSSLLNTLIPDVNTRTAEISDVHDQGMHTTTFSEMYVMPDEEASTSGASATAEAPTHPTYIIDTPGIKGFGTIEFEKETVSHYFREIFKVAEDCRFGNCTHTHEPGCAVLQAVQDHRIAQSRYDSYLSILDDEEEGKYRE